jgi:hypothetical protein
VKVSSDVAQVVHGPGNGIATSHRASVDARGPWAWVTNRRRQHPPCTLNHRAVGTGKAAAASMTRCITVQTGAALAGGCVVYHRVAQVVRGQQQHRRIACACLCLTQPVLQDLAAASCQLQLNNPVRTHFGAPVRRCVCVVVLYLSRVTPRCKHQSHWAWVTSPRQQRPRSR